MSSKKLAPYEPENGDYVRFIENIQKEQLEALRERPSARASLDLPKLKHQSVEESFKALRQQQEEAFKNIKNENPSQADLKSTLRDPETEKLLRELNAQSARKKAAAQNENHDYAQVRKESTSGSSAPRSSSSTRRSDAASARSQVGRTQSQTPPGSGGFAAATTSHIFIKTKNKYIPFIAFGIWGLFVALMALDLQELLPILIVAFAAIGAISGFTASRRKKRQQQ